MTSSPVPTSNLNTEHTQTPAKINSWWLPQTPTGQIHSGCLRYLTLKCFSQRHTPQFFFFLSSFPPFLSYFPLYLPLFLFLPSFLPSTLPPPSSSFLMQEKPPWDSKCTSLLRAGLSVRGAGTSLFCSLSIWNLFCVATNSFATFPSTFQCPDLFTAIIFLSVLSLALLLFKDRVSLCSLG